MLKLGLRQLDLVKEYTGYTYDSVLNVYYAKARMYDPNNRRFLAVDPIKGTVADPQSMVQYSYVLGNPLKYTDSTGMKPDSETYDSTDLYGSGSSPVGSGTGGGGGASNNNAPATPPATAPNEVVLKDYAESKGAKVVPNRLTGENKLYYEDYEYTFKSSDYEVKDGKAVINDYEIDAIINLANNLNGMSDKELQAQAYMINKSNRKPLIDLGLTGDALRKEIFNKTADTARYAQRYIAENENVKKDNIMILPQDPLDMLKDIWIMAGIAAMADSPAPGIGDLAGILIGIGGTIYVVYQTITSTSVDSSTTISQSISQSKTNENKEPTVIYRSGSGNGTNLTPRVVDATGLSYFTTISSQWSEYTTTTVETINATGVLFAYEDPFKPGHYLVLPVDITKQQEWIDSRPNANSNPHVYTQILQEISAKIKGGNLK